MAHPITLLSAPELGRFDFVVLCVLRTFRSPATPRMILDRLGLAVETGNEISPVARSLQMSATRHLVKIYGKQPADSSPGRPGTLFELMPRGHAALAATRSYYSALVEFSG
jgi:hypothetical protein